MAAIELHHPDAITADLLSSNQMTPPSHWITYFTKASFLCVLLYAGSVVAPSLPLPGVAALWAAVSVIATITPLYTHVVLRKTVRHQQLQPDSTFFKLNNGRILSIIVLFVVSAFCSLTLILQAPGWKVENWLLVLVAIFVFPAAYLLTRKLVEREYTPFFRQAHIIRISCVAVTALLLFANIALTNATQPTEYAGPVQAVLSVDQPFENSPSTLISDLAWFSALSQGLTAYGMSAISNVSYGIYEMLEVILSITTFYSIACLFGVCWLRANELKTAFSPIKESANASTEPLPQKRYVVLGILLPVILIGCSIAADEHAASIEQSGQVTQIKSLIRSAAGFSIDVSDGTYYDHALLEQKFTSFATQADEGLTPLITQAYQTRINNVDSFLDWYCDSKNWSSKLFNDDSIKSQLAKNLNANADDSTLATNMQSYIDEADALQRFDKNALSDCAITCEIPDWLIKEATSLDSALPEAATQSVANIVAAGAKMGITPSGNADSATVSNGIVALLEASDIGKKLTSDIPTKIWTPNREQYKQDLQNELTTEMNDELTLLMPTSNN